MTSLHKRGIVCGLLGLLMCLSGCRWTNSAEDLPLDVTTAAVMPASRVDVALAAASTGDIVLHGSVELIGDIGGAWVACSGGPVDDVALVVGYAGPAAAWAVNSNGQQTTLAGLLVESDPAKPPACSELGVSGIGLIANYQLRVTDAAALASQPMGDFDLIVYPRLCLYNTDNSHYHHPDVPPESYPDCALQKVLLPVHIVSVPAVSGGTLLTLAVSGPGQVSSTPSGIACGADCDQVFAAGTTVTLTATPDAGARLVAFSGDPDCADGMLNIGNSALHCGATFATGSAQWSVLGTALNIAALPSQASAPAVAMGADQKAVVAWVENGELAVKRWDGSAWQRLGAALQTGIAIGNPSMVLDDAGQPWVAWAEDDGAGGGDVFVKYWDGSAWRSAGNGSLDLAPGNSATAPHLAWHNGHAAVAWVDRTPGTGGIVPVQQWDGSAWSGTGGPGAPALAEVSVPRLLSTPGSLFVAFIVDGAEVRLGELSDGVPHWQQHPALPVAVVEPDPSMALAWSTADGVLLALQPTGASTSRNFQVQHFQGGVWAPLGGVLGRTESTARVSGLALSGSAGHPWLVWSERYGAIHRVVVRRWNASFWAETGLPFGADGRTGPGIEGPVAVADGIPPVIAYGVDAAVGIGQFDRSIMVREFR